MAKAAVQLGAGATIPIVDFADYTSGAPVERRAAASAIRQAFEEYGFLYLRNHGVPPAVVDAMFAQSHAYFALPTDAKARAGGYSAPGYIRLDPTKPVDMNERFRVLPADDLVPDYWPSGVPGFREAALGFHAAASAVCQQVMQALAVGLGLPQEYFDVSHDPHSGAALMHHYPPVQGPVASGQQRAGAHTDFGTIALLFHDGNAGGLEIQRPDGSWLPAPSLPDRAIVNVGDLLARWSNDQLRSVLHRVVVPDDAAAARSRYSAVLFYQPRYDAVITCLEPCQGPERPPRYPPITAGEHLQARRDEALRGQS